MFMVLSSWKIRGQCSLGLISWIQIDRRLAGNTQTASKGCYYLRLPSPFIIITQPET